MSHFPSTPRVASATPTPSDTTSSNGYFGPMTRSVARKSRVSTPAPAADLESSGPDARARTRSRSPILQSKMSPLTLSDSATTVTSIRRGLGQAPASHGHLAPPEEKSYWRQLSRSPSPLGLIPVHLEFRQFVGAGLSNVLDNTGY
jgi:diacylglycerol kinase (CTP)